MLTKVLASTAIALLIAPNAASSQPHSTSAQDSLCYMVASNNQTVNLTALCNLENRAELAPIVVTNLSLEVPKQEFLSSKVKATVTNRSSRPIQIEVVQLQISRAEMPIAIVPIFMNETLKPGQSVFVSELFDKAELQGQEPGGLSVRFQNWQ
ncbi:hypothetical protein [Phormidesmis priestleyi]